MSQQVHIHTNNHPGKQNVSVGEHTLDYMSRLKISDDGKRVVCNEASEILSHCIAPKTLGTITNLAVGYVQSGKTMSFTMLTALAADNGYKVVIYLTGTKTNLQDQTANRLKKDLNIQAAHQPAYRIFEDFSDLRSIKMFLSHPDIVLLFPILKHYKHINALADVFLDSNIRAALSNNGVLIIDDEADQASLNTYAYANTKKEDWEEEDISQTYAAIIRLKRLLACHSYIQYTATPQSLLMIDTNDVLSPTYHTVLTPGDGYTGGKFFFVDNGGLYIRTIPPEEVETRDNYISDCPESLIFALRQFLLSVCYKVLYKQDEEFLSMMVHIDGLQASNTKYKDWVDYHLSAWYDLSRDSFAINLFMEEWRDSYNDLLKTAPEMPSLETLFSFMSLGLLYTQTHLVQSGAESTVDWDNAKGHILFGANMLNRGFTIEKLSMTFMPRTNSTVATADTIEQRCRFFGYKSNYTDVCRIYVSQKAREEFTEYVEHEEMLRAALQSCPNHTLKEYKATAKTMLMSGKLKPTRRNILSDKYVRSQLFGWKQFRTADFLAENLNVYNRMISSYKEHFVNSQQYGSPDRNHKYVDISVEDAIYWLSQFQYYDFELRMRKQATIQYLEYMKEQNPHYPVRVYQIAYASVRRRKLDDNDKPITLHMGYADNGSYPGDSAFRGNTVTIQLHHIRIDDRQCRLNIDGAETCNIAISYPDDVTVSYYSY